MSEVLTVRETSRLAKLVAVVDSGLRTFVEVGLAIKEIRESHLYRNSHGTFEEFCRERWGWSKQYAARLMKSGEAAENLKRETAVSLPTAEWQVRPLTKLSPNQQAKAWVEAVEVAGGVPTGPVVEEVVRKMLGNEKRPKKKKKRRSPIAAVITPEDFTSGITRTARQIDNVRSTGALGRAALEMSKQDRSHALSALSTLGKTVERCIAVIKGRT